MAISLVAAIYGVLSGLYGYLFEGSWPEFSTWVLAISFCILGVGILLQPSTKERIERNQRLLAPVLEDVSRLVNEHRGALAKNLSVAVKRDDYGTIKTDNRKMIWADFFDSVGLRLKASPEVYAHAVKVLNELEKVDSEKGFDAYTLPTTGREFEIWVAKALEKFGWTVEVTKESGDQGVDIIAIRNGRRLGIQCKLYSGKIGNKAVQEAHTGKAHYRLDVASVLSNSEFTSSARNLADSTGTYLFSHFDIPTMHKKLPGFD
jgi:restriction system protein